MTIINFKKLLKTKQTFIITIYSTLIIQLLITFIVLYLLKKHIILSSSLIKKYFLLYIILFIGIVIILIFIPMYSWLKLIIFTLLSIIIGIILYNISSFMPKTIIEQALIGTIVIFIGISIITFILSILNINLDLVGLVLLGAFIGFIISSIILFKNKSNFNLKHKVIFIIFLIIFGIYIIYQTNIILQKDYNEDFINASIGLYLNFINIFVKLLTSESSN